MASTYSSRLRIELIGTGEQSGIWGDTTNTNLGTLIEEAIAGVVTITMTDANYTLSEADGATDESRQAVLVLTGTLSAGRNVIAPAEQKVYIVKNSTTGGYATTIKTSGGSGYAVGNGKTVLVYCDGTDFYLAADVTSTVNPSFTGNISLDGPTVVNDSGADSDFRVEGDTDANLIFADASTDRVGIGTNTPSVKLDVNGDSSLNGAVVINEAGADKDFRVEGDTDVNLIFGDASTDRVGIGTSTPSVKLDVNGDSSLNGAVVINDAGADKDFRVEGDTDANLIFGDASADAVGIGTSTPGSKLDVKGTLRLSGSSSGYVGLSPAAAAGSTTYTLPSADGTSGQYLSTNGTGTLSWASGLSSGTANTFTAAQTFRAANAIRSEAASTQDAIVVAGRAGGTSSYAITLTPTTLSSSTTLTLPNVTSTVAVLGTAQTFTALQTFSGSTSVLAGALTNAAETTTVSATAATGTIAYDVTTQSVLYYTSNASANWTVNFRASSGTSLNTAMATGQSITVAFLVTQGATAYYNNAVQVDGSSVTPKWQGGTAPTAGNASSIDVYTYTIVKTGSATFTVFASQTQFK